MQDYIMFNGVVIKQPDGDGYSANLATTSTDDSDRDMALGMHNTPIGTIAGYSLKWSYLTAAEMSQILKQVVNKGRFTAHYFDVLLGKWTDGEFYATNYNAPALCLEEGFEMWDELSFNIVGVNPV